MNNAQIAEILDQIADLLEFQNENPFRVRAYRNSARTIHDLAEPVSAYMDSPHRDLTDLEGIGKDLAEKIRTLIQTGRIPLHQELLDKTPPSVLALLRVPGLGPKKAALLHKELKVKSLEDLRNACEQQKVRQLKGFGEKTEQTILAGLEIASQADQRMYWAEADLIVQRLREYLCRSKHVHQLEIAGSYRRGKETIGDLDILVDSKKPEEVMNQLAEFPEVEQILQRGETKMSVRLIGGLQVDLRVVEKKSFGAALQYFTGSKEHNVVLRTLAKARGFKINEYGLFKGERYLAGKTEEEVYAALDLPCFPPELREARREFEWAQSGKIPKLIELDDLRGDLHSHTNETDGQATLEEMAQGAIQRGLAYLAITDHSQRVSMANGLDAKRLRKQWDEIDKLNTKFKNFRLLKGIEVDILEKGGLDLPDKVLEEADWVVASVHYGQNQPREQITRRIVDALANPCVSAIAHPTGRLLNRRKPYEVDLEEVFQTAKRFGKMLELNANPARLDLDDVACAAAKAQGIPIVISTDAHSVDGLDKMRYGVLQARRAGLTRQDVANTKTWNQLRKMLGK